jgi:hypothetical protein
VKGQTNQGDLTKTKILRRRVISVFVLVGLGALLTAGTRVALPANIITVINTNDNGPGSLRQALIDANDGDTIDFDPSLKDQKITLTSGQLNVDKDVIISGPGANHLAVDGNAQSRVFYINPGKTVTISDLTITNGSGGGIVNSGLGGNATLAITNCTVSGNSGGGIGNFGRSGSTTLTITNCTVSGNSGGGISTGCLLGSATATITNCTVSGNFGRGIDNSATYGGATLTITNTTIRGNSGGGIANANGQTAKAIVTVSNSTISSNWADSGGGIYNSACGCCGASIVTVRNSTISSNAAEQGGGIYNTCGDAELGSTILNANSPGENIFGTITSLGYNVSSDDGGGYLNGPGDQINIDPLLGPLQDNGGPTFTHALLPDSPAINAGDPSFTPPPDYDQRGPGFDRVVNGRIDIGSFEIQSAPTPTPTATVTPTPTATASPRPTPTARPSPSGRPRPTPAPR